MYSLIETAKLNGVNPQAYLADILSRIAGHPAKRIAQLLPWTLSSHSSAPKRPLGLRRISTSAASEKPPGPAPSQALGQAKAESSPWLSVMCLYWIKSSIAAMPFMHPLDLEGEPVRRLSAGGNWIRTSRTRVR